MYNFFRSLIRLCFLYGLFLFFILNSFKTPLLTQRDNGRFIKIFVN